MRSYLLDQPGVHLLIDPDKWSEVDLSRLVKKLPEVVKSVILGGTYVHTGRTHALVSICSESTIPVGVFVGAGPSDSFLCKGVDFAVVPFLLGARTSQFLTDQLIQVLEPAERLGIRVHCTGYFPLYGGTLTSCDFFTQHTPAPRNRPEIVSLFAKVADRLGLGSLYLDAGSGTSVPVTEAEIRIAAESFPRPILVGGGIRTLSAFHRAREAGATAVVIGTVAEETRTLDFLSEIESS